MFQMAANQSVRSVCAGLIFLMSVAVVGSSNAEDKSLTLLAQSDPTEREIIDRLRFREFLPRLEPRAQREIDPVPDGYLDEHIARRLSPWRALWRETWEGKSDYFFIAPAPSVRGHPACPDNLGIDRIVEATIDALRLKQYGDALRLFDEFQSSLQCVDPTGAMGVDFALSAYVHRAISTLSEEDRRIAVQGVFNLGLLTMDQVLHHGHSWWLAAMKIYSPTIQHDLQYDYDGVELGLWFYNLASGTLVYHGFDAGRISRDPLTGPLFAAFAAPHRIGQGDCDLISLAQSGFRCSPEASFAMGGTGGGGGGGGPAGGGPLACLTGAAAASSMMACIAKSGKRDLLQYSPLGAAVGPVIRGLLDDQCVLQRDGASQGEQADQQTQEKEENFLQRLWSWINEKVNPEEAFVHTATGIYGDPITSTAAPLLSEQGAEAGSGLMAWLRMRAADKRSRFSETGGATVEEFMDERAQEIQQQSERRRRVERPAPDEVCADATNAARRISALFDCTGIGGMPGERGVIPTDGGPQTVSIPAIGQLPTGGGPSKILSCGMQGGGLVRSGPSDSRCTLQVCPRGSDTCSCDGAGGGGPGPMPQVSIWEYEAFWVRLEGVTDPPVLIERPDSIFRQNRETIPSLRVPSLPDRQRDETSRPSLR